VAEDDREMLKEENWRQGAVASCPHCEAPLAKMVKFCPECGQAIGQKAACASCGADLEAGQKFCASCGAKA
ncbi:MAG: zinc-ribbon domain-containing protein, partial [Actinobacteria bacterium]|nr:zinc-ribbon domain-containing protein [Actinomycetota bacterium]